MKLNKKDYLIMIIGVIVFTLIWHWTGDSWMVAFLTSLGVPVGYLIGYLIDKKWFGKDN